jgi:hypothetical protein
MRDLRPDSRGVEAHGEVAMTMFAKLLGRTDTPLATAPTSSPKPTANQAPAAAPATAAAHSPRRTVTLKRSKKPAKLWPIADRRGVIVATSKRPVVQETAATHAAAFMRWLQEQEDYAGRTVLYEVVGQLYAGVFCPTHRLKPIPWRTVAKEFDAMPGVGRREQYIDTGDTRRRVKKHVYVLPCAAVVEIGAVRLRA